VAFEHSMVKAARARKTIPATGRVAKQGPTQMLQECVGESQYSKGKQAKDRQSAGVYRILARSGSQQKDRRLTKKQ
jgi:hypothetical protein